jgi:uncharacterized phage protein (TIGR01671 family)
MRQILFRGKTESGFWEYGFYSKAGKEHFIEKWDGIRQEMIFAPVLPETAGEYTGLNDKNGKIIFEGDIVSYHHATYTYVSCLIKYEPAKAGFCLVALDDDITINKDFEKGDVMSLYIPMGDVEVIGNIHDNPELLKEGEEE